MSRETLSITLLNDDDTEETHELPAKFEVCERCEGHGTHLHTAIGQHAYSVEEFNEEFSDDEDREAYFRRGGKYDVTCEECGGRRVVLVVDENACRTNEFREILQRYQEQEQEKARWRAEDRATMRMECGYFE